jgi:hypothetical protein
VLSSVPQNVLDTKNRIRAFQTETDRNYDPDVNPSYALHCKVCGREIEKFARRIKHRATAPGYADTITPSPNGAQLHGCTIIVRPLVVEVNL